MVIGATLLFKKSVEKTDKMIEIKTATIQDIHALAPLFDAYRVFYKKTSDLAGAQQFLEARLRNAESIVFLATDASNPCGFIQLYPLFSSTNMAPLLLLNDFFMAPEYRGKQIGMALLQHSQEYAKSSRVKGITLETEKANLVGNQLYPKMGFSRDEEHHFYFWENPTF